MSQLRKQDVKFVARVTQLTVELSPGLSEFPAQSFWASGQADGRGARLPMSKLGF